MSPERANELWDLFLIEQLDDAGARELLAYLQANPEELQRRRAEAAIHAGLRYLFGSEDDCRRLMASVQARLKSNVVPGEESEFEKRVMSDLLHKHPLRYRANPSLPFWISAAAVACVLLVAGYFVAQKYQTTAAPSFQLLSGRMNIDGTKYEGTQSIIFSPGQTLVLDAGATAHVTLGDGTDILLSESARLALASIDAPIQMKLEHGLVEIDARPQPAGKEMILETRQARVRVLGTKYRVLATESVSHVDVERGSVAVSSLIVTAPERTLEIGQAVTIDRGGLGTVIAARARALSPNDARVEGFTDPVQLTACDSPTPWPARKLSYTRPAQKSLGYGGAVWKTSFESGEDTMELWIRPRRVELVNPDYRIMKVVMLASTGPTEYRLGDVQIFPTDREWILLRGRFAGASINWQEPGNAAMPLQPQNVRQLSLRTEIGNIDFDFGPVNIIKSRP